MQVTDLTRIEPMKENSFKDFRFPRTVLQVVQGNVGDR